MKPLAIVCAMAEELGRLLHGLQQPRRQCLAGREFWLGHLAGQPVVLVLSRIGKVAAATTATLLAQQFGVGAIVFTGVAGGLGAGVRVGDVVVADALLQHDMDASPIFPRFEVPLYGRDRFPADAALAAALMRAAQAALAGPLHPVSLALMHEEAAAGLPTQPPQVHRGLVISGDRFVSSRAEGLALRQSCPDALAVEMEGAALAQVCADFALPFAVIRTISDRADDAAHLDFGRFIETTASRFTQAIVMQWLGDRE